MICCVGVDDVILVSFSDVWSLDRYGCIVWTAVMNGDMV